MQVELFDVKKNKSCKFVRCKDSQKQKELFSYGFIFGVEIEILSKAKHCVVVRVLDGVFSLNCKLAKEILVEVDGGDE